MNWKIFSEPLGGGDLSGVFGIRKKNVLPLAVPLVMAGLGAFSSVYGGAKSAAAGRKAQKQLDAEQARLESERRRRMNEDYLDTAAGQNLMRIARDERDKAWKRAEGAAAVAGGTEAATAMAKEAGNNMVGETIANIAAGDSQRKDAVDAGYRAELDRIHGQQIANEQARSQAVAQAASGASNALMNGALATFGGTKVGQELLGGGAGGGVGNATDGTRVTGSPAGGGIEAPVGRHVYDFRENYGMLTKSALYNPRVFWGA